MRSQRRYFESNGLRWSRLGLVILFLVVATMPIPLSTYCLGVPLILFGLVFMMSLDTTRFVYQDVHQIPYKLSTLTRLSANDVVEGYYQISLHRLPLLLGFPARRFNWAVGTIISIWLVGCSRTLLLEDKTTLLTGTLFSGLWGAIGGFTLMIIMLAFYQVFSAVAIREGLKASNVARASLATSVENIKILAIWLIGFFVISAAIVPTFLIIASVLITVVHVLAGGDILAVLAILLGVGGINLLAVWSITNISRIVRQDSALWHQRRYTPKPPLELINE